MSGAGAYAVVAGGGTAGHVVPGLAIAEGLVRRGVPREQVHYVGSSRGIETRLVPDAGFPLTVLPGRGIQRRLTLANVGAILGLVSAVFTGIRLVRRLRPAVVVGLGGYASVPCVIGAVLWRVPIVVAEQNAVPGLANRLAGRFAKACAVSFDGTDLPRATWTGNPVRPEVVTLAATCDADRQAARTRLGLPADRAVLAVFGGSLGARRINDAVADAVSQWSGRADLAVRHVTGTRDHAEMLERVTLPADALLTHQLVAYEDDMPSVYAAADLVLCRAGASSVAELAVAGVPAVLVPLPGAPGDHQTANAAALVDAGAAVLVPDSELDGDCVVATVGRLLDEPSRLAEMARSAAHVARPDAAAAVVDLVDRHARYPRPETTP
ncbi:MAG: undecaprenyldiphospho-muramoylpentapeptide beta-N-acetylglucosaminyltransferase [Acidimicrobiales bacterium]|nr:undecaprenyldiphospho-muramoylpentapeptide beta-N-acetylglucosaminyltransferase [Acidimicrobiales bacterium]